MKSAAAFSSEAIFRDARRRAIPYAILQPESAIVIAIAIVMTGLCLLRIFWFPDTWWLWIMFGVLGVAAIVVTSLRNEKFLQQIGVSLFYQRVDKSKLRLPELRENVSEALEYHRLLFQEIARRPYAPLSKVADDTDHLVLGIYHLAYSIDSFVSNDQIKRYLLGLLKTQDIHPSSFDTLDEYTTALVPIKMARRAADPQYETEVVLNNVCQVISSSHTQIHDAVKNISAAHRRIVISTLDDADTDWRFVDVVRDSFADHLNGLKERTAAMNELCQACEVAAAQPGRKQPYA